MKICPTCQRCYDDADFSCPKDHAALVTERAGTRLLIGKYHLECLLGRGDKGNAYEATDVELNSPVIAVELHGTKVIDDPQEMQRFHREARQAVRAGGQDVADIYDYGPLPNGGAYVVMERIVRDLQREHSITKPPLITQPMIGSPIAPPNERRESSSETSPVQSEAIAVESTEEETRTSSLNSRAASDAMARLTEEETLTFPAFETATHRIVDEDAAAIHKATAAQEPSLIPPAPPVMTSTPFTDPDQSAQRTSPIVVEVPGRGAERNRHRPLVYGGALAAAVIAVATVWFAFNREQAPSPNLTTPSVTSPTTERPVTSLPTTNASVTEPISPASTKLASPATIIADDAPPATVTRRRTANVQANNARVVLGQILNHWIAATAQRNVEWQMSFYMPVLATFYRQSDVPQDFVRQEKARLFSEAQTVEVRLLDEPQITFSEGGRVATMRFRLSNVTEGDGQKNRPSEVRRELRWRKTDKGWKIFSERDL